MKQHNQEQFIYKNDRKLRCGYTTGTCAAAATKVALAGLLFQKGLLNLCTFGIVADNPAPAKESTQLSLSTQKTVRITTPSGVDLEIPIERLEIGNDYAICGIKKDAGDDIDVTDGLLVVSKVSFWDICAKDTGVFIDDHKRIRLKGGEGVGVVTREGLEVFVGEPAINPVPRAMIAQVVEELIAETELETGVEVEISVPEGKKVAEQTFNARLGVEGGISILGTSGIVEPMSDQALLDTIFLQLRQLSIQGNTRVVLTPGNYGRDFIKENYALDLDQCVKCSNFIGETLEKAAVLGFTEIVLIGHIGKLVKLGAGIMNTHSAVADGRMETLVASAVEAGITGEVLRKLLHCTTTKEALELLEQEQIMDNVMKALMHKIRFHLEHKMNKLSLSLGRQITVSCVVFSKEMGVLGEFGTIRA
ncbi:MAG: cobalt-precorrin-5B (C(1))-methyltransferase CbiD [Lachnospiraceae bacterium]|nr:cobalt-precorrin-5B (C(1))-methyltransferase CbiD [Lachnospiraceae bacterium]